VADVIDLGQEALGIVIGVLRLDTAAVDALQQVAIIIV
jgi:hypothetical protein